MKLRLLPWIMQMWAMPLYMTPFLHFSCFELRADQVETQSGDRYVGKVLSVNADTLVLQSEVLGTVRLPRAKVAQIILGTNAPAVSPVLPASALPHPTAAGD